MSEPMPYHCRHIFTDGHQCGSPALRGEKLCFYHHASRNPPTHITAHDLTFLALPTPDDFHAIQRGIASLVIAAVSGSYDAQEATPSGPDRASK